MDELQRDAQIIDGIFHDYGITARVSRQPNVCFQSSTLNVMPLSYKPGTKIRQIVSVANEIDQALTGMRSKPIQCRFELLPLRIMTPRRKPESIDLIDTLRKHADSVRPRPGVKVLVGEKVGVHSAVPRIVDLSDANSPHVLIAGTSGSGKTTELLNMAASLSALNDTERVSMIVLDPHAVDLHILDGLPGMMYATIRDVATCVDAMEWTIAEMDRRQQRRNVDEEKSLVVFIDEIAALMSIAGDKLMDPFRRLLAEGRKYKIHVVGATQNPLAEIVSSDAKANFPVRIVGKVTSKVAANTAAGIPDTDAERLPGKGSFVLIGGAHPQLVQAYMVDKGRLQAMGRVPSVPAYRLQGQSVSTSVRDDVPPVRTAAVPPETVQPVHDCIEVNAVETQLDFDLLRTPTKYEARVIRAMLKTHSKNAVIRSIWPTKNKNMCLAFIDAATGERVTA